MSRKIKPDYTSGTSGYPFLQNSTNKKTGLDFLQLSIDERFDAMMRFLTQNQAGVWAVIGAVATITGGNYSVTAGWIYYNSNPSNPTNLGELFYVPAVPSTTMGGNTYLAPHISDVGDADDPVQYSDGTNNSPHRLRTITFTPSPNPNTGDMPDTVNWNTGAFTDAPITVTATGTGNPYDFKAGYSPYNELAFWKDKAGLVHIQGDFTSAGTDAVGVLFNLPPAYRPDKTVYAIMMTTGSNYATYKENVAYFITIGTNGNVSSGYNLPSDAGNYSLIVVPYSLY